MSVFPPAKRTLVASKARIHVFLAALLPLLSVKVVPAQVIDLENPVGGPTILPGADYSIIRYDYPVGIRAQWVSLEDLEGDDDLDIFWTSWQSGQVKPLVSHQGNWTTPYSADTGHFTEGDLPLHANSPWTEIKSPDLPHPVGMCDTGTHIWVANNNPSKVAKINKATKEIEAVYDLPAGGGYPYMATYDGSFIWVLRYNFNAATEGSGLVKIDPETGAMVGNFPHGSLSDMLFDGVYIWAATSNPLSTIYKIDPTTETELGSITLPANPGTLVFDGEFLWSFTDGVLYKMSPETTSIVDSAELGVPVNQPLTYDGDYLYIGNFRVDRDTLDFDPYPFGYTTSSLVRNRVSDGHFFWATESGSATIKLSTNRGTSHSEIPFPYPGITRQRAFLLDGESIWIGLFNSPDGGVYTMKAPNEQDLVSYSLTMDHQSSSTYKVRLSVRSLVPLTNPQGSISLSRAPNWSLINGDQAQLGRNTMLSQYEWEIEHDGVDQSSFLSVNFSSDQFSKCLFADIVPLNEGGQAFGVIY